MPVGNTVKSDEPVEIIRFRIRIKGRLSKKLAFESAFSSLVYCLLSLKADGITPLGKIFSGDWLATHYDQALERPPTTVAVMAVTIEPMNQVRRLVLQLLQWSQPLNNVVQRRTNPVSPGIELLRPVQILVEITSLKLEVSQLLSRLTEGPLQLSIAAFGKLQL